MPWRERNVLDQRIEFAIRASREDVGLAQLCREYGISRPTGYLWKKRFTEAGTVSALTEKSRRAHRCPHKTSRRFELHIVRLRKKWGWGAGKLQVLLKEEHGIEVPVRTINRIIVRNGLVAEEDRVNQATKRFERKNPNELWQMDFKGEFRDFSPFCFPLTILDDHSRFNLEIKALKGTGTETVDKSLINVFEQYGIPDAMLMDHGSPWWSTHSEHGLTRLSINLIKQGIKLYYSGVGHPQTQGKIERFHRTLAREVKHRGKPKRFHGWQPLFNQIRSDYNNIRPHESLGMKRPAERYTKSKRQYHASPAEWEYPVGSQVQKVDAAGCVRYKTAQMFVCHSLAGNAVRIEHANDKMIVGYRHMIIREIDLKTGVGKPTIHPKV